MAARSVGAAMNRVFRIGLNIDIAVAPLSRLMGQLKVSAPDVELVIQYVESMQMLGLMMSGDISVGIGLVMDAVPGFQMIALGKTAISVVWRQADESDAFQTLLRNELLKCFNVIAPSPALT